MTLTSIPTIWSSRIRTHLERVLVYGAAFTNRDYEGEIKDSGDTVNILSVGEVTVSDYLGQVMEAESLTDEAQKLVIDQRKHFNFHVDDVDARASALKLVDEGSKRAAQAMSNVRDRYVAGLLKDVDAGNLVVADGAPIIVGFGPGEVRPYDALLELTQKLDEADVPISDRHTVLPAWFVRALKVQFGERSNGLGESIAVNGKVGTLDGIIIHQSNNVPNTDGEYKCAVGRPFITFADAVTKVETYRPEKRFATGVRGLYVYGGKLTHPTGFAVGTFKAGKLTGAER